MSCFDSTTPYDPLKPQVLAQITINNTTDADARHADLLQYVWKGAGIPAASGVANQLPPPSDLPDLSNLDYYEQLSMEIPFGPGGVGTKTSIAGIWHPKNPTGDFILVIGGHSFALDEANRGQGDVIAAFLRRGWTCAAMVPPDGPSTWVGGSGDDHETVDYGQYDDATYSGYSWFLAGPTRVLNYVNPTGRKIAIGLSFGSKIVTWNGAVDQRWDAVIAVAGVKPELLYGGPCYADWATTGHYDSRPNALINAAGSVLNAMLLCAYAPVQPSPVRQYAQVVNQYETGNHGGLVASVIYGLEMQSAAPNAVNGSWGITLDDTHGNDQVGSESSHRISSHFIMKMLDAYAPGIIAKDESHAVEEVGTWTFVQRAGKEPWQGGVAHSNVPGNKIRVTFDVNDGIVVGKSYVVRTTWNASPNRGTANIYRLFDSSQFIAQRTVNQQAEPAPFIRDLGDRWTDIGTMQCDSGILIVELEVGPDGYAMFDGAWVEELEDDPDVCLRDVCNVKQSEVLGWAPNATFE